MTTTNNVMTAVDPEPDVFLDTMAMESFGFRRQTWAVLRMRGGGPEFIRAGRGRRGKVLYSRKSVLAWLAGRTRRSTAEEAAEEQRSR